MKKFLSLLGLCLCFVTVGIGQDAEKRPTITVVGTAEVETMPDEVVFTLDVTKRDKDLQIAKRMNDESVGKILELTRSFNVKPQNVKTDSISVNMKYRVVRDPKVKIVNEDGEEIGTRTFLGYEVSKNVTVRLTEISRFEEFFTDVLKTGLTQVRDVTFETSKFIESRVQAREMAMKAARDKAVAMTAAIDQTIGKAIMIQEGVPTSGNGFSINGSSNNSYTAPSSETQTISTTFAPGAIKVEAKVTIIFLLN